MKTNSKEKKKEKMSRKKILLIIVCIFTAILIIFGATLGIIVGVRNARATVYMEDVRLDEGECNYLASYYKYRFIRENASNGAVDTPAFWNAKAANGRTYAEMLKDGVARYIKEIVILNYLFNSYCEFTKEDEYKVKAAVAQVLEYKADNSKDKFNEIAAYSGFDFDDFEACSELLFKASALQERVFGAEGEKLQSFVSSSGSSEIAGYLDDQLSNYSHVKLLFIRTEDTFKLDESGNRVINEDGEDTLIPLTDEGKAKRAELISQIRAAIEAYNVGSGNNEMTPDYFNALLNEHGGEGDVDMNGEGYYFSTVSAFTIEFSEGGDDLKNIVDTSIAMNIDTYKEVAFDGGVCFIYKYKNTPRAYLYSDAGGCFSDFYSIAVGPVITSVAQAYINDVVVKDELFETDFTSLNYNYLFVPSF